MAPLTPGALSVGTLSLWINRVYTPAHPILLSALSRIPPLISVAAEPIVTDFINHMEAGKLCAMIGTCVGALVSEHPMPLPYAAAAAVQRVQQRALVQAQQARAQQARAQQAIEAPSVAGRGEDVAAVPALQDSCDVCKVRGGVGREQREKHAGRCCSMGVECGATGCSVCVCVCTA